MPSTAVDLTLAGSNNINPPRSAFTITPHNDNELPYVTRAIKVGNTSGNLVVVMADNPQTSITIPVQAGDWLPIQVRKVLTTSTATTLTGFY